ncbi:hypothetical protein [Lactococcus garvieae]|uniref:Uncharacterized protein n=2 Tax=Lactococcus garvieae TaxID=1363 RepID=A0A1I4J0J4_9LACT|nr:hypothetical protein [Lactococcus garvieae]SFL60099.1 hypothetical protein SAMN05216438_1253 [Lactococcus garvieae]
MNALIEFFRTITGVELSYVLLFMVVIDIGFAAYARKSIISDSLKKAALFKLGYALVPVVVSYGERGIDLFERTTPAGRDLVVVVVSLYFILILIAEMVSIASYYKIINPTATNFITRFVDRVAPAEVKAKMDKLGLNDLLNEEIKNMEDKNK